MSDRIYAKNYPTVIYKYLESNSKTEYKHILAKYTNYKETYVADNRKYKVFKSLRC
jgi:hypothetical protein